jgi:hypothetical protein
MGLTNTKGFRGSAAFFALLLAGTSGAAVAPPSADATAPDHEPAGLRAPGQLASQAGSKFSRRLLPPIKPARAGSMLG